MDLPREARVFESSSPNQRAKSWLDPPPKIRTEGEGGGLEPAGPRSALEPGAPGERGVPELDGAAEETGVAEEAGAPAEDDTASSAVSATKVGARWLS